MGVSPWWTSLWGVPLSCQGKFLRAATRCFARVSLGALTESMPAAALGMVFLLGFSLGLLFSQRWVHRRARGQAGSSGAAFE